MIATHRIKNNNNKTVGFMFDDGGICSCRDIAKLIDGIDNLIITKSGQIKVKSNTKKLPEITVNDINKHRYKEINKNNKLVRDIQGELYDWKKNWNNLVLYLRGPRKIGKTTEILRFAYKNYENIIYINIAIDNNKEILENLLRSGLNMYTAFAVYCNRYCINEFIDSNKTIIIIDEIQESYIIYNYIRNFQELKSDVVVSGSYLGRTLNSTYFMPVGNIHIVDMLPLSFNEFCRALKLEQLLTNIDLYNGDPREDYAKLEQAYDVYRQIGGYPEVVREYTQSESIIKCRQKIRNNIDTFTEESAHYFTDDKCTAIFDSVYTGAIINMIKERSDTQSDSIDTICNFIESSTKLHVSRDEVSRAIYWLRYSGIIRFCDLYNQEETTELLMSRKFYFTDCGILNVLFDKTGLGDVTRQELLSETFVINELQRLYKTNKVKGDKPCCSVHQQPELDFMLVDNGTENKLCVGVKTSNVDKPKSLMIYIKSKLIDEEYISGMTYGEIREKIRTIPIYTVGCRYPYK